jgi:hypothetical protein
MASLNSAYDLEGGKQEQHLSAHWTSSQPVINALDSCSMAE